MGNFLRDKKQKNVEIFIEIRTNYEITTCSICAESAEAVQKLLTEYQKVAFDMLKFCCGRVEK